MEYFHAVTTNGLRDPALSILTVLAAGRRHGYAIIKEAGELTGDRVQLKVSSLYAALERLEAEGLAERSGDEVVDGRVRRYFVLTDAGAEALREEADRLEAQAKAARRNLAARGAATVAGGAA